MKIILNGKEKSIISTPTLKLLIEQSCQNPKYIIAELNGSIVKNHSWEKQTLQDGDHLELVNFVGGG